MRAVVEGGRGGREGGGRNRRFVCYDNMHRAERDGAERVASDFIAPPSVGRSTLDSSGKRNEWRRFPSLSPPNACAVRSF